MIISFSLTVVEGNGTNGGYKPAHEPETLAVIKKTNNKEATAVSCIVCDNGQSHVILFTFMK